MHRVGSFVHAPAQGELQASLKLFNSPMGCENFVPMKPTTAAPHEAIDQLVLGGAARDSNLSLRGAQRRSNLLDHGVPGGRLLRVTR
jgi:hypothetical protein